MITQLLKAVIFYCDIIKKLKYTMDFQKIILGSKYLHLNLCFDLTLSCNLRAENGSES